jgi:hypothetical protein
VCDPVLLNAGRASTARYPYAIRAEGRYCDGVIAVKHASELFLLSLTLGHVTSNPANPKVVELRTPVGWKRTERLRIRASELSADGLYRLDGGADAKGLIVDRAHVLDPLKISTEQLGFKAWIAGSAPEEYVPIVVGRPPDTNDLVAVVRTGDDLRLLDLEVLDASGRVVRERDTVATNIKASAPQTVVIPRPNGAARWIIKIGGETFSREPTIDVVVSVSIPALQ